MYPPSVSEPIMKTCLNLITKPNSAQPTVINACDLFKHPQRASRPDHFVVILRGLPGLYPFLFNFLQKLYGFVVFIFFTKKVYSYTCTIETEIYHVSLNYT